MAFKWSYCNGAFNLVSTKSTEQLAEIVDERKKKLPSVHQVKDWQELEKARV